MPLRVLTLTGYRPPERADYVPWIAARLEGSPDAETWTAYDTLAFENIDADPCAPMLRDMTFTFDPGADEPLWFRVVWVDQYAGESQPTTMVVDGPIPYACTVAGVASQLRARTKDRNSEEVGTFNDDTRPTAEQVAELIERASYDVYETVGPVPSQFVADARVVVEVRTAMLVERSYSPEQVDGTRTSLYRALAVDYEAMAPRVADAVHAWLNVTRGLL